jgi:lysophospholipase L1-like esterase
MTIAHSGRGICRNAGSKIPWELMPDLYQYTIDRDSTTRWSVEQSAFRPDLTVIYLGANDFSGWMMPDNKKFNKGYLRLLSEIKANYGEEHPILCMTPGPYEYLLLYVRDMVNNCGMQNVYFLGHCPQIHNNSTDEDLGAGWHPNYNGQQKIAYALIPYIATITGWGLQDMPVK